MIPKRHPLLYILALSVGLIGAFAYDSIVYGAPLHTYPYSVAPRLLTNCESKWIGTEYHITPQCTHVWSMLTREQILDAPIQ